MFLICLPSRTISHLWTTSYLPRGYAPFASLHHAAPREAAHPMPIPCQLMVHQLKALCASADQSHRGSLWVVFSLHSDLFFSDMPQDSAHLTALGSAVPFQHPTHTCT